MIIKNLLNTAPSVPPHTQRKSSISGPEEHQYVLDLELYDQIDKDDIKQVTTDRTITLVIAKLDEGPYWPRLLKAPGKTPPYIKADWDKWVDEDEEDELDASGMGGFDMSALEQFQAAGAAGAGGFDLSQLGDLAAMQGMNADEDDDEEGEEVPPLTADTT